MGYVNAICYITAQYFIFQVKFATESGQDFIFKIIYGIITSIP